MMYETKPEPAFAELKDPKLLKRPQVPKGPRPELKPKHIQTVSNSSDEYISSEDSGFDQQKSPQFQNGDLDLDFDLHPQAFSTPTGAPSLIDAKFTPGYELPPIPISNNVSPEFDISDEYKISPNLLSSKNPEYKKPNNGAPFKSSGISDYEYVSEHETVDNNAFDQPDNSYPLNDPSTSSANTAIKTNPANSSDPNTSGNSASFDSEKHSLSSTNSSFEKASHDFKTENIIATSHFQKSMSETNAQTGTKPHLFIPSSSNPSTISSIENESQSLHSAPSETTSLNNPTQNKGYESDFSTANQVVLRKARNNSQNDLNVHSMLFRKSMYSLSSASLSRASMGNNLSSNRISRTLLDTDSAMNMYREAALKTNDESIQLEYAKYLLSSIEVISSDKDIINNPGSLSRPMSTFSISPSMSRGNFDPSLSPSQSISSLQIKSVEYESSDENKKKLVNEAVYWIKLLQKKGNAEASYILATWLENGKYGIVPDKSKAYRLYMFAAKCHHAKSAFKVAEYYEIKKLNSRAFSYYKVAAALSNSSANYRMATCLLRGELGMRQNLKTAMIYLRRSAELADDECPDGAYVLALIYLNEYPDKRIYESVFGDNEEAHKLLDKAAHLGMPEAQHKLGFLFEFGEHDFPANPYASIMYYRMAADSGFALSQMALSGWYLSGAPGVLEQSDNFAFDWCSRAAEQGLSRAQFGMGYYYDIGIGVERDSEKAMQWYRKAAENGSIEAKERLEKDDFANISASKLRKQLTVNRKKKKKEQKEQKGQKEQKLVKEKNKEKEMCSLM
ncbi:Chitin synthase regulatory factor 3 [Smittium mucronatum]|uniref:Chitin synthase regulatory factor 3 n=1 Tax=Smittium mucronatum TaxID=133383 RepID=A0A1R0H7Y6_9FUNG|nr:Chitin synthase regulatory factor 3 [Smittium mucronatum]